MAVPEEMSTSYRGRLAPTPTGLLHLGHAATFGLAWLRARRNPGALLLYREEDLDPQRCKPAFAGAALEDLRWLGLDWDGALVRQSDRRDLYLAAWERLRAGGFIYPSTVSRKDLQELADVRAPQEGAEEPVFPPELRPPPGAEAAYSAPAGVNWRFRVPDGRELRFHDMRLGAQCFVAGRDFGDFIIWRRDDVPAYELAVVVDDSAQGITEIVRGGDLLLSTARQLLLYEALECAPPEFYHTPLLRDADGQRLAKRSASLALRELREQGVSASALLGWVRALGHALDTGAALPTPPVDGVRF